jgi:hypothetical protein
MVIMYPTPLMNTLESMEYKNTFNAALNNTMTSESLKLPSTFKLEGITTANLTSNLLPEAIASTATEQTSGSPFFSSNMVDDVVWWFFWVGIYVDPKNSSVFASHFPMYILITLFVLEKLCQRWLTNRFGCSLEKVREYKVLEEKIKRAEVEEIKKKIAEEV